jgi:cellulose synthase operon protein C
MSTFPKAALAVAIAFVAGSASTVVLAQNDIALKTLGEQARFWQSRGRNDRAAESWTKMLKLDPKNREALSGLAQFEVDNNRADSAKTYLDALRQTDGGAVSARKIENEVGIKAVSPKALTQARAAAKAGRNEEAAKLYREVFSGKSPSGQLALEYYQTLGGSEGGWEEARQGLARATAEDPSNVSAALAYGQHLTYRAETRREGIRLLTQLSRRPEIARTATDAWRKALIWLEASRNDAPLYQAFLTSQPGDSAIRNRLDNLTRVAPAAPPAPPDSRTLALREGFTALNSGDIEQATINFQNLIADNPNNTDALGGLGVIRLKQERFSEAERLLSAAARGSGSNKWNPALNSARFWLQVQAGQKSREAGQLQEAKTRFMDALRIEPDQFLPAIALAEIMAEEGKLNDAERIFRGLYERDQQSLDAVRGLMGVLAQQGRIDDAAALADRLSEDQREKLGGYGKLKGEQMRRAAATAALRGDTLAAMQMLEDALLWDPGSPWLRLELARLYQAAGATHEAKGVVDGLLLSSPDHPEALHVSALMAWDSGDWFAGLNYLERIPAASRTKEMGVLQTRLWVRAQADRVSVLARAGQSNTAKMLVRQIESVAGRDAELLGAVAQAYIDAGEEAKALVSMRQVLSQTSRPDLGMRIQYAAILLKTRQDAELAAQLRQLYTQSLTERQREDVDKIRYAYSIRQFDTQREANNLPAAYEILMPMITERPDDTTLQLGLARLYASSNEHREALAWYDHVLQKEPDNLDALMAAAGSALAIQNYAYAQSAIANGLQIAADNPTVLSMLGRLYRAQGKTQLASEAFQRALLAEQTGRQQTVLGPLGMRLVNYTLPVPGSVNGQSTTPPIPPIPLPARVGPSAPRVPSTLVPTSGPQEAPSLLSPGKPRVGLIENIAEKVPRAFALNAIESAGSQIAQSSHTPRGVAPNTTIASTLAQAVAAYPLAQQQSANVVASQVALQSRLSPEPLQYGVTRSVQYLQPIFPSQNGGALPSSLGPSSARPPIGMTDGSGNKAGTTVGGGNTAPQQLYGTTAPPVLQTIAPQVQSSGVAGLPIPSAQPIGITIPANNIWLNPPPIGVAPAGPVRPLSLGTAGTAGLMSELEDLKVIRSGSATAGGSWRGRSGDAGTSSLSDFSIPVETRFPLTDNGHLVLRVTPVLLDAGQISKTNFNTSQQFGTNAFANAGNQTNSNRSQQDAGVAIAVGYETLNLKLDIGTSPLGFATSTLIGGVAYNESFGNMKVKLDVSRRSINDSLLSYAGTVDDRTGQVWGGVTATGLRAELGLEEGQFGVYGYGAFHFLNGKNVVNNTRMEGGAGAYYKLMRTESNELTTGLAITALGFDKNLRYFTFGHGGYFSPQRYFSLNVPVEWSGRSGSLSYKLDGSIGVQTFKENAAAYFPGSATMQTNWETLAATSSATTTQTGVTWQTYYPGQSKTGLGFRLGGAAEYRFAPQWIVGGKLGLDNASDYLQTNGMFYVRYNFEPSSRPMAFPPRGLAVTF